MLRRRLVSIPAVLGFTLFIVPALPVLLMLALLHDAVRRTRLGMTRTLLLVTLIAIVESIGLTGCFLTWVFAGLQNPPQRWTFFLQRMWQIAIYRGFERIFNVTTQVEPYDAAIARGPFLLFSRHAGYFDTLLPLVLFGKALRPRYVLKRELLADPCLDVSGHRLPNCFVGRGASEIRRIGQLAERLSEDDFVVIFPEGGRFTEQARASLMQSRSPLVAERATRLRHVLPPQRGGVLGLLSHCAADVVFCVHTGLERLGDIRYMMGGGLVGSTVFVKFWRIPRAEIPSDTDARVGWLHGQWIDMDGWLGMWADRSSRASGEVDEGEVY